MSLEAKIDTLTAAVNRLADLMEKAQVPAPVASAPTSKPTPVKVKAPEVVTEAEPTIPATDMHSESLASECRALCRKIVGQDSAKKPVVREVLASFSNAKLIDELADEDLPILMSKLKELL